MLNRPSANSATHPSQIFLRIHPCSNNSKTRLEAFVYALTWNGLGLDFLRDSTKPFGWFSDSFTQVAKWKRKRLLPSPKNLFMKPTPFFRHFAICEYAKQAHISGYSHQNTFCGACANKMPICSPICWSAYKTWMIELPRYPVVSYPLTFRTQAKMFPTHFRSIRAQPSGRFVPKKLWQKCLMKNQGKT